MEYIAMDLLGKYSETSQGHCYVLTVICMLTSFVEVIHIEDKKTETVIKAYFNTCTLIKADPNLYLQIEVINSQVGVMSCIADQLGFTKVYTLHNSAYSNRIIERYHCLLKNSIRKLGCNHDAKWDELIHIDKMAYNTFPHSAAGESPFFLMYGKDAYLPTLHQLLLPKMRYMGDDKCRIQFDTMREIYMMAVLNLKMSWDWYPPPTVNPWNIDLKVGDLILIKNQTPQATFYTTYKPGYPHCEGNRRNYKTQPGK